MMAQANPGVEKGLPTFGGFDSGMYTLYIGLDHKRLNIPGYVLMKIPPINKLIIEKTLLDEEPVSLEAYDPEAFASVLTMVRDGHNGFKISQTSQQLIKAYIVAFDLNLEHIQNFLVNQIKVFHWTHPVRPGDFELLYAAELTSDCKLHTFLLHKMAHDFQLGLHRTIESKCGISLDAEHIKEMEGLNKIDLLQLSHQVTHLSTKWQCVPCQDPCFFHDHVFTPRCMTIDIDGNGVAKPSHISAAQPGTSTRSHTFRFTVESPPLTNDAGMVWDMHAAMSGIVTSGANFGKLLDTGHDYMESTPHTKVAEWLEAIVEGRKDQLKFPVRSTDESPSVNMNSAQGMSRDQNDTTIDSTETSDMNVATPKTSAQSDQEIASRDRSASVPAQPLVHEEVFVDGKAPADEKPDHCKAEMMLRYAAGKLLLETLRDRERLGGESGRFDPQLRNLLKYFRSNASKAGITAGGMCPMVWEILWRIRLRDSVNQLIAMNTTPPAKKTRRRIPVGTQSTVNDWKHCKRYWDVLKVYSGRTRGKVERGR